MGRLLGICCGIPSSNGTHSWRHQTAERYLSPRSGSILADFGSARAIASSKSWKTDKAKPSLNSKVLRPEISYYKSTGRNWDIGTAADIFSLDASGPRWRLSHWPFAACIRGLSLTWQRMHLIPGNLQELMLDRFPLGATRTVPSKSSEAACSSDSPNSQRYAEFDPVLRPNAG